MEATDRFAALLTRPEPEVPLDEAALLVAAHAYPHLDLAGELARLDELAERCYAPTLDALVRHLFVDLGYTGNETDYYDPRNSYLNEVTARRTGIPITLGVLAIEVGRRIGVPLAGVGMPGHFLLRDRVDPEVFVDPFARGAYLDRTGCRRAFWAVHGPEATFDEAFLEPVGKRSIVARILGNLKMVFARRGDLAKLRWVLELRLAVPGVPRTERRDLVSTLVAGGQIREAADQLERLAAETPEDADDHRRAAARLRARLN